MAAIFWVGACLAMMLDLGNAQQQCVGEDDIGKAHIAGRTDGLVIKKHLVRTSQPAIL